MMSEGSEVQEAHTSLRIQHRLMSHFGAGRVCTLCHQLEPNRGVTVWACRAHRFLIQHLVPV